MVAADTDVVPLRHLFGAIYHHVPDDPEMRLGWESPFFLGDVLFENVSLNCASKFFWFQTLPFGNTNIHRSQNGCWGIDRHAGTDFSSGIPSRMISMSFNEPTDT